MSPRIHRHATILLVIALCATLVPFSAPAAAAEVGIATVGSADLRALSFTDANTGFIAAANGQIWKTTDGGSTWTAVRNADGYSFRGIDFRTASNGVAVDYDGKVSYTTAGGDSDAEWLDANFGAYADMDQAQAPRSHHDVTWVPSPGTDLFTAAGDPNTLDDIEIPAHAMGSSGLMNYWWNPNLPSSPHVSVDPDSGTEFPAGEAELLDIDFASSTVGWASAIDHYPLDGDNPVKYPLYKLTYDTVGYQWSITPFTLGGAYSANHYRLEGVALGSTSAGITVGSLVADNTARVFYTTNGGTGWTAASTLPTTNALNAADMADASNGWAVGVGGTIVRTTDGGANWTACTVPVGFTSALYDVEFIPGTTTGWAVGEAGAALRTTDGINWTAMSGSGGGGDTTPPTMGAVTSSTHPVAATWYANNDPALAWSASDASGIAGYSYVLDTSPSTTPDTTSEGTGTSHTYTDVADGLWYFHVRAQDDSANHNWSSTVHRTVYIDTTAPTGAIFINGGAATTNTRAVTLTFTPSDTSGVIQMRLSNDGAFDTSPEEDWQSYTTPKSWTLPAGDGAKFVYVQFRDRADNQSNTYFDGITLDTTVPATVTYVPLQGSDRYGTAVAVSQSTFPTGSNAVIVATGLNFPDALASAGLAGAVGAPVLLVHGTRTNLGGDGVAATEISRLLSGKSPRTVFIVGGPSAVSTGIESALKTTYGAANVVRLGGTDRYDTARIVAVRMKSEMASRSMAWTGDAFIVPGLDFRDALIVGPESYARHAPILLYDPRGTGGLTSYCATLGVTRGLVSGAPSASAGYVPAALSLPGVSLVRLASAASAPARSTQVASWAATNFGMSWSNVGIATTDLYPDGLSAAPRQGINNGPLLLTPSATLDATVASALTTHRLEIAEVRYFGGPVAITAGVRSAVDALLP